MSQSNETFINYLDLNFDIKYLKDSETFRLYFLVSLRHLEFNLKLNIVEIAETFRIYYRNTETFKLLYHLNNLKVSKFIR